MPSWSGAQLKHRDNFNFTFTFTFTYTFTTTKYYYGAKIKENDIGGEYSTHKRDQKCV
jgi:hypothetical protein